MAAKKTAASAGKDFLSRLLEPPKEPEYIETGNIGFDMVLSNGKGLPLGSSVLLWAEPGVGKSTLFVDIAKRLIAINKSKGTPFKVLYFDVEGGAYNLIVDMGLKSEIDEQNLIYYRGQATWGNIEDACEQILKGHKVLGDVKLIIIDSVGQVLSNQNMTNSITGGDFGTKAKERGNFYTKYFPLLDAKGVTTFLVSQARQNQEATGMYDPKTKAAASWSDKHNVDIIIKCSSKQGDKFGTKQEVDTAYGTKKELHSYIMQLDPTAQGCKARTGKVHANEILIEKGVGARNFYPLFKILELHSYLNSSGGWYTMNEELSATLGEKEGKKYRATEIRDILEKKGVAASVVNFLKERGNYSMAKDPRIVADVPETTEEKETAEV